MCVWFKCHTCVVIVLIYNVNFHGVISVVIAHFCDVSCMSHIFFLSDIWTKLYVSAVAGLSSQQAALAAQGAALAQQVTPTHQHHSYHHSHHHITPPYHHHTPHHSRWLLLTTTPPPLLSPFTRTNKCAPTIAKQNTITNVYTNI